MTKKSRLLPKAAGATLMLLVFAMLSLAGHATAAPSTTAERVQMALAQLDGLVNKGMTASGVPGMAVVVVYKDRVVYMKGFGVRQTGKPDLVDADTVFQLASVSKPLASTVISALVGDGVVSWDDRIIDHDPGFQMYTPYVTSQITLRDMFAHRSGLPDHAGDLLEDQGYDRATILERLRFQKPDSSFRAGYAYTNYGITEAAVAAARASGMSWEDVSASRLYRPLGMNSTSSRFADYAAAADRAYGHVLVDGAWVAKYVRDPDPQTPAGGVSSSVRDMAQWMRLQLGNGMIDGKQVVASAPLLATRVPQIVNSAPGSPRIGFYGLGWNVRFDENGRLRIGHSGGFSQGAGTVVNLVPSEDIGITVLSNATATGYPEAIAASFLDLAMDGAISNDWFSIFPPQVAASVGPTYGTAIDYSKPPAQPGAALAPNAYAGTYHQDFYGDIEVVATGGGLVLEEGPNKSPFPMQHWDRDVFLYQPTGENAYGLSAVSFQIGADGLAATVTIEILDARGEGSFTRVVTTP